MAGSSDIPRDRSPSPKRKKIDNNERMAEDADSTPTADSEPLKGSPPPNRLYSASHIESVSSAIGLSSTQRKRLHGLLSDVTSIEQALLLSIAFSVSKEVGWTPNFAIKTHIKRSVRTHLYSPFSKRYTSLVTTVLEDLTQKMRSTDGWPGGFFEEGESKKLANNYVRPLVESDIRVLKSEFKTKLSRGISKSTRGKVTILPLDGLYFSLFTKMETMPDRRDCKRRLALLRTVLCLLRDDDSQFWQVVDDLLENLDNIDKDHKEKILDDLVVLDENNYSSLSDVFFTDAQYKNLPEPFSFMIDKAYEKSKSS